MNTTRVITSDAYLSNFTKSVKEVSSNVNLLIHDNSNIHPFLTIAPLNVGLSNTFSFDDQIGLELNINFAFNFILSYDLNIGYLINPVLKFRYNSFSVGIDVSIMKGNNPGYQNDIFFTLVGLTVGGKF